MKQAKYTAQKQDALEVSQIWYYTSLMKARKLSTPLDAFCLFLALCSLLLWSISLSGINVRQMNNLGLISVLHPLTITALMILLISFSLALRRSYTPLMLLHLALLIFMLYGITTLIEEVPRFSVVYRHAGYTEYIMRTGTIAPHLDAYFNWPGFFIGTAFVTQILGYHDILGYAAWASVFFNLIYLGPLYMLLTSATSDKRLIWLGLWFFYLTNWVGQDYFSPQGFNFFLYLVIIAILLKWFKVSAPRDPSKGKRHRQFTGRFSRLTQRCYDWLTAADDIPPAITQPWQRTMLLGCLLSIFALVVFSHPLTPFFVLASVTALVLFRRCTPWWLPILMTVMTGMWIIFMTQAFLAGHLDWLTGSFGNITSVLSQNVTNRVTGDPQHTFITQIRVAMTFFIWILACIGGLLRLRQGRRDVTFVLLAIAPFPLLAAQAYGGEMLLRIYLFSLPLMSFFAAAIFFPSAITRTSRRMTIIIAGTTIVLLCGFLFTRYGNESMDYMTNAEVDGVRYLYSIAQPNSIFIAGWDGAPWRFQDYEKYETYSMSDTLSQAVATRDVAAIVRFINHKKHSHAYLIFTRAQKATIDATSGLPPGALDRLEKALLASGKFQLVYSNPDAQIMLFTG